MKTAAAPSRSVTPEAHNETSAAAWRERSARLYQDLRRPARAMIRRAFGGAFGDDEIEDVYGNAWLGTLRALQRRHADLTDEEVRKYVLTAVAHHASKELRRRGRKPTAPLDEDAGPIADGTDSLEDRVAGMEESRIARDLLATLPPRRRAVMLLRYGWGLDPTQVCGLVKGLSARAYRKEITRGVDELTEKLRLVERGEWCADREPVLKAFAAGLADDDQQRQARHHLAHCRHCTEFVGRLTGHLHDLGSSIAVPGAAEATLDGRVSLPQRLGDLAHRAGETLSRPFARSGDEMEVPSQVATGGSGARGAGAVGGGVVAKLGSSGIGAKVVGACLAGAAGGCIVAGGVVPGVDLPGLRQGPASTPPPTRDAAAVAHGPPAGPSANPAPVPGDPDPVGTTTSGSGETTTTTATTTTTQTTPPPPPVAAEFGVEPSAPSSTSPGPGSSGSGASAPQREFGP
jgi:DNA-directed RNA polymerase specialized sigma24 family protein